MASVYVNLPKKLMAKIEKLETEVPNIAARVLGAGVGAAQEHMAEEFKKAANKGYSENYTAGKINFRQSTNSTKEHPQFFIGVVDQNAASRMRWVEGGRIRHMAGGSPGRRFPPGARIQKARPFMGKVRKYIRSRECEKLMTDRFYKIIDSIE